MASADGIRAWSRLTTAVASQAVLPTVQGMHRAISDGTFRWMGPPGRPVKRVHDRVVGRAYEVTDLALRSAGQVGEALGDGFGEDAAAPSGAALKARAIAHGVVSQELLEHSPELDLEVTLRLAGAEVPPEAADLRAAYPAATDVLTVFVHGLVDSEEVWSSRVDEDASLPAVARLAGSTPLLVRYGTGRAVGRNGADLAELLDEVVQHWPVPVTRIVVVGHSMGGLVTRAACATAAERSHGWLSALTDVVYLGTPHFGSWLEKAANVGGWALRRASTRTAPIAALLEQRSRGIKDLRHGTLLEDGWGDTPIDDLLSGVVPDEPWLAGVTHHLVVGRLRASPTHPLTTVFGDTLVRSGSAIGTGRRRRIADGGPVVVTEVDASHTALVRAPAVGALLAEVTARAD